MAKEHLLALDQGTSSSRAIVFHASGRIVAMAQREFRQIFPQPGWVEHDANEIWDSQLAVAREALDKAGLKAGDIAALGITNQRETTLLWNRVSGAPIHHAIVWQDRRTEPLCAQLRAREGFAEQLRRSTGLVIDPYFSGTKIRWLLDNVAGAHVDAAHGALAFGTIDSWLLWKLTNGRVHATDVSNASRTMLFDIRHNAWDPELLKALHIPDSVLPKVHAVEPPVRRDRCAVVRRADPDRGHRGRPTERTVRPGVLQGRAGQEHLRHRLLHADAQRRAVRGSRATASSRRPPRRPRARRSSRSKAASSSVARSCSGSATACVPSPAATRFKASPPACPTPAA